MFVCRYVGPCRVFKWLRTSVPFQMISQYFNGFFCFLYLCCCFGWNFAWFPFYIFLFCFILPSKWYLWWRLLVTCQPIVLAVAAIGVFSTDQLIVFCTLSRLWEVAASVLSRLWEVASSLSTSMLIFRRNVSFTSARVFSSFNWLAETHLYLCQIQTF